MEKQHKKLEPVYGYMQSEYYLWGYTLKIARKSNCDTACSVHT